MKAEQWMSGSGLKVNLDKTEFVIFYRQDTKNRHRGNQIKTDKRELLRSKLRKCNVEVF